MATKKVIDPNVPEDPAEVLNTLAKGVSALVERQTQGIDPGVIAALVNGVNALVEQQNRNPRDVTVGELRPETPWNPTGELRSFKKYKNFYQNGVRLNPELMTTEELELFTQIRPGVYNGRKWHVIRRRDKSLDLRYPNKTIEQRMELKGDANNLTSMLKKILIEQEEQARRRKLGEYDDDED